LTTTHCQDNEDRTFIITHPAHPLRGTPIRLAHYTCCWSEDRVFFYDKKKRLTSIPARWTNLIPVDPIVTIASGRSFFKASDLLELVQLIQVLKK